MKVNKKTNLNGKHAAKTRKAGEGTRYPSMSNYVLNTLQRITLDFNFTKFNSIVIKHNFEKKSFSVFSRLAFAQHCERGNLNVRTEPNNLALTSVVSPQDKLMCVFLN